MPKYKCVIWDWNGTLFDDLDICINVMNRVLKKRSLPQLTVERYRQIFSFPIINYYKQLGFDFETEPFEHISTEFVETYQKDSLRSMLKENCVSELEYIQKLGIRQVILSASQQEKLEEQVRHFGIMDYFEILLGLDNIHAASKIEIGKRWLSESGLDKKEVLLVGDTLHDYETAFELGCDCILLVDGHQSVERVSRIGVPVVRALPEIRNYLMSGG